MTDLVGRLNALAETIDLVFDHPGQKTGAVFDPGETRSALRDAAIYIAAYKAHVEALESWKAEAERNGSIAERMIDAANERSGRAEAQVVELLALLKVARQWPPQAAAGIVRIDSTLPPAKGE